MKKKSLLHYVWLLISFLVVVSMLILTIAPTVSNVGAL